MRFGAGLRLPVRRSAVLWLRLLALLAVSTVARPETAAQVGVIVEKVLENFSGHRAGLKPGDVIISWRREATPPANPAEARGEIRSWFDLIEVEYEQSCRGKVWLHGSRAGVPFDVVVPPGEWFVEARPISMPAELGRLYVEGSERVKSRDLEAGVALWRQAALRAEKQKRWELAAWLQARIGAVGSVEMKWHEVNAAYQASAELAEAHGLPLVAAMMWDLRGRALMRQNSRLQAKPFFDRALELNETHAPGSLRVAQVLIDLGRLAYERGDLEGAEELFTRAMEIVAHQAPDSFFAWAIQMSLGVVAGRRGQLDRAEGYYRDVLALSDKLDIGGLAMARASINIGDMAETRGDLRRARQILTQALTTLERIAPERPEIGAILNNLAIVAQDEGDLDAAESWLKRSLKLEERLSRDTRSMAAMLGNLGNIAIDRGDLDAAESFHRRGLALVETYAPESLDSAAKLTNLGTVMQLRGDLTRAEEFYRKALALQERHAPLGPDVAKTLARLGALARSRRDYAAAERALSESLRIEKRLSPDSLSEATTLVNMAGLAIERKDPPIAEKHVVRALAIVQRLAPGSALEATCFYVLAAIRRSMGQVHEAAELLRQAVTALDVQRGRAAFSEEARATYASQYADVYRAYVEVLAELNRGAEAFQALERSRARAFLARLAERDIVFDREIPAALERERRAVDAAYDRSQALLARADPNDRARVDPLLSQLRDLKAKQDEVAQRVREASPRLAALKYPVALDVARVQQALDAGTVLLSYSVGPSKTLLFVVSASRENRKALAVHTIDVDRGTLRREVQTLRRLIGEGGSENDAFQAQARRLFDRLIAPARSEIAAARRVVICPDDQLHALPFAALYDVKQGFLVRWRPIHLAASATVYAELLKGRSAALASEHSFLGFGDPKYPGRDTTSGPRFTPLPGTRRELQEIASLFGDKAVVYTGEEATEERVKAVDHGVRYLHFACHGFLDDRFPLNSGLALTMPAEPVEGGENGLLQAWEIIERVRIRADLVTLSACEAGAGQEVAGEGIVGLTRAFQFAGAQSVLASLWSAPDRSTVRLMTRLYRYLKEGYAKDEALRAAQIDLIEGRFTGNQGPASRRPFAWAGFQLAGDWR